MKTNIESKQDNFFFTKIYIHDCRMKERTFDIKASPYTPKILIPIPRYWNRLASWVAVYFRLVSLPLVSLRAMLGSFFNLKGKLELSITLWYLCPEVSLRPQGLVVLSNMQCLYSIWSWPALYWDACRFLKMSTLFKKCILIYGVWGQKDYQLFWCC